MIFIVADLTLIRRQSCLRTGLRTGIACAVYSCFYVQYQYTIDYLVPLVCYTAMHMYHTLVQLLHCGYGILLVCVQCVLRSVPGIH